MLARWGAALLICLLGVGCATSRPEHARPTSDVASGRAVDATLGAPFYALFKAAACIVSVVVAVPSNAGLALTDRAERVEELEAMNAGVGRNCGDSTAMAPG